MKNKSFILLGAISLASSCLISANNFHNKARFEISEKTDANEDAFGKSISSGIVSHISRLNENELENALVEPNIGIQTKIDNNQTLDDTSDDKISIRYVAAIASLDVEAVWTRIMYNQDGSVLREKAEKRSLLAYDTLVSGDDIINASEIEDSEGNHPYNHFVIYTMLNIPYEQYAKGMISAYLTLSANEQNVSSKTIITSVDGSEEYSFATTASEYIMAANIDGEEKCLTPYEINQNGNHASFSADLSVYDSFSILHLTDNIFEKLDPDSLLQDKDHFEIDGKQMSPRADGQYNFYISSNQGTDEYIYVSTENLKKKLYFKPNEHWASANARFAVYAYGSSGNVWYDLEEDSTTGYYFCSTLINTKEYQNVIFGRMNPDTTENNFNDGVKWNQTGDLSIKPSDIGYDSFFIMDEDPGNDWQNSGSWRNSYAEDSHGITLSPYSTVRFEAEKCDLTNYVKSGDNSTNIVERADASDGKFLAAATGNVSSSQYATFKISAPQDGFVTIKGSFAQTEGKKANTMDMTKTYKLYLVETSKTIYMKPGSSLAPRDDITQWEQFEYNRIYIPQGITTVRVLVVENTGKGNPNIDYFDIHYDNDLEIRNPGTYKMEAEKADYSRVTKWQVSGKEGIVEDNTASNGAYLAASNGTTTDWGDFRYYIKVDHECYVNMKMICKMPGGEAVGSLYKRYNVTLDDESLGNISGSLVASSDWQETTCYNNLHLLPGNYVLKFSNRENSGSGCPHIDYFSFNVSYN